jgi:hypothetical protein
VACAFLIRNPAVRPPAMIAVWVMKSRRDIRIAVRLNVKCRRFFDREKATAQPNLL